MSRQFRAVFLHSGVSWIRHSVGVLWGFYRYIKKIINKIVYKKAFRETILPLFAREEKVAKKWPFLRPLPRSRDQKPPFFALIFEPDSQIVERMQVFKIALFRTLTSPESSRASALIWPFKKIIRFFKNKFWKYLPSTNWPKIDRFFGPKIPPEGRKNTKQSLPYFEKALKTFSSTQRQFFQGRDLTATLEKTTRRAPIKVHLRKMTIFAQNLVKFWPGLGSLFPGLAKTWKTDFAERPYDPFFGQAWSIPSKSRSPRSTERVRSEDL